MKKLILVLIVLAAIGGGAAAYYMSKNTPEPTVTTLQLTRGDIVDSVGATGTLEAVETVDVGTQVSGTVQDMYADFNSIVKKGQIIARLDPSLLQTQIEQQRANVTRAEADLERLKVSLTDAEQKLGRAKELSAKSLIPRTELETAEINVQTQKAQIRSSQAGLTQARSQLNTAEVNLGHTVIRSPIDGIVISRNVDQGQTVAASMNAPVLYSLAADLTKMQVVANIDEAEIGKMRPGQPVTFKVDAYPTDNFRGAVQQVRLQPTTVQNVVTYATVISVPNEELKLKPGMTATVTIEISRKNNVLRAPNAALRFRPNNDIFAALKQPVPPEMQRGAGRGPGGPAGADGRGAGFSGASGQQQPSAAAAGRQGPGAPAGPQAAPTAPDNTQRPAAPSGQSADRPRRPQPAEAQGGGDRGGDRPAGDRTQGGDGRRSGFGNMTPEQREAFRKQREERLKNMSPEERAQFEARMRERGRGRDNSGAGAQGGGRGQGPGTAQNRGDRASSSSGGNRQPGATAPVQGGSRITNTTATTIDALFAPLPPVEGRGRVWLYINKQLKPVSVRTGITDGTWTEVLETSDTAQLQPGTELVTNVTTGLETQQRPGQQGPGSNPLMPQRGQPGRGGPGGGGGGRGR